MSNKTRRRFPGDLKKSGWKKERDTLAENGRRSSMVSYPWDLVSLRIPLVWAMKRNR
jgi:hypothetical protein